MQLLLLIPLSLMILSDYRSRTVAVWQLLLFGAAVLVASLLERGIKATCINLSVNISISLLAGLCVYTYFLLKYKSAESVIGKGDLLFILFLTPYFPPREYLVFTLFSFVATLLAWFVVSPCQNKGNGDIPLVSGVGTCLCTLVIYRQFFAN